ncbi:outer membrane protein assembly factor BamD [Salinisphaera sp. USBA-960]|uniref:outer membrane protein assembly factor BamD n=1 Tax=Salinisphaera orenii TaxID=856731 RepID=UPI0013A67D2A|nr:outer membrane protein assembly factor BamD [Salifodinibacter halophilus]NNC26542.1 outer membrane protein assembly factor BamD [Salifodinibacter halophilus]
MRIILLILSVVVVATLAGCANNSGINETGYSDKPLVDSQGNKLTKADAKQVYRAAHQFLVEEKPDKALRLYANIGARFPFSSVAVQAALETITAHQRAREYKAAVKAADQFIKQHPQHAHIDYAYYMRGVSNYKLNKNHFLGAPADRRNVDHLIQAFSDFKIVTTNYPQSDYAADARQHMVAIRNRVAKFNLRIANYYLARDAYVGASQRANKIIENYQGAQATPKALQIMQQSYQKLDMPQLAAEARSILQASYPQYLLNGSKFEQTSPSDNNENSEPEQASS